MVRFEGRAKEATTIPTKPTPTGFKVWILAQLGFLWAWNFHVPGQGNGPVDVLTPRELGGTKAGKGGNKTQAVVVKLVKSLPRKGFHIFLDNLFTSTKLLEYLRSLGFGVTGTARTTSGMIQELVDIMKNDKNDTLPWGVKKSLPTPSNKVWQVAWKDNSVVLLMSTVLDGK